MAMADDLNCAGSWSQLADACTGFGVRDPMTATLAALFKTSPHLIGLAADASFAGLAAARTTLADFLFVPEKRDSKLASVDESKQIRLFQAVRTLLLAALGQVALSTTVIAPALGSQAKIWLAWADGHHIKPLLGLPLVQTAARLPNVLRPRSQYWRWMRPTARCGQS